VSSYFKTALRSLFKNKSFTALNIFGLTAGFAIFMLIVLFVADELSFDRYNKNAERIFRVNTDVKYGETFSSQAIAAPVVASTLMKNYPEVQNAVRLLPASQRFEKDGQIVFEERVAYSDASLFDIFTLPAIKGDAASGLAEPGSIVITASAANKYFGQTDAVGKHITMIADDGKKIFCTVKAVIHDVPKASHFHFDFFLPMSLVPVSRNTNFASLFHFTTFILMKEGADYRSLESKFPELVKQQLGDIEKMSNGESFFRLNLTPLTSIHLHSNRQHELGANGSWQYVKIFSVTAMLILLMACFNFINITTAQSSKRVAHVSVKKILGASRWSLIRQFVLEALFIMLISMTVAIIADLALLPLFSELSGKELFFDTKTLAQFLTLGVVLSICVGILAGAYPALWLSSFKPAGALKGKSLTIPGGAGVRNVLVVLQFSLSVFMIVATLVIYNQRKYIQDRQIGFDRHQVLVIKNMASIQTNRSEIVKQELKGLPGVLNVTASSFLPTGTRRWQNYLHTRSTNLETQFWPVDENYIGTLGMQIVKGRNFSNKFATDSSAMIINETAAKLLGYSADPINKPVYYGEDEKEFHIIGVVKDFNFSSLRENISPAVMLLTTPWSMKLQGDGPDNLCVRIDGKNISATLDGVFEKWKELAPGQYIDYSFMDEDFNGMYRAEQQMGKLFILFTCLAIVIACLGLFGLSAYAVERRAKEITIRKILGANGLSILTMLSIDFLKMVFISIAIAAPLSWWVMQRWLENYAYRSQPSGWLLAVAGCIAVASALLTISYQTICAANVKAVTGLKYE
jgi:putative ABC transport system permease protein